MILAVLEDTLMDGIRLLPFLFITYLVMEYIEHKTGEASRQIMKKSGSWGPALGGLLGAAPQCGFSAAASNLYAGGIITPGTLIAVFLSTSDEMLPVLVSEQAPVSMIAKLLGLKAAIGICIGFLTDLLIRRRRDRKGSVEEKLRIEHLCSHQRCRCGKGRIISSALRHSLQIFVFILVISFALNLLVELTGSERLEAFLSGRTILGPLFAGLIGLIPNCASSVLLTRLYLSGMLSSGSMLAGLLSGSGVGLLVLFKVNDNLRENLKITLLLYSAGALCGIIIEIIGGHVFF